MKAVLVAYTALLTGALMVTTAIAPPARATCISFSGLSLGSGCSSTFGTLAIGIGANTTASSSGLLTGAIAVGNKSTAISGGAASVAIATGAATVRTTGTVDLAYGGGGSTVNADGLLGIAASVGGDNVVNAGPGVANVALALGDRNTVTANGNVNLAASLGSNNTVAAIGNVNNALQLVGDNNTVAATGNVNSAINLNGARDTILSGPGPFAVGFALRWIGTTVVRQPPGLFLKFPRVTIGGPGQLGDDNSGGQPQQASQSRVGLNRQASVANSQQPKKKRPKATTRPSQRSEPTTHRVKRAPHAP